MQIVLHSSAYQRISAPSRLAQEVIPAAEIPSPNCVSGSSSFSAQIAECVGEVDSQFT
jgi:hypothetical protein